jgi:hypothetical protein
MSVFSEEFQGRGADKGKSKFVKTDELLSDNSAWELLEVKPVKANDVKFGASETDALYKSEVLKKGETVEYSLIDTDGNERTYQSKGAALFIAVRDADILDKIGKGKQIKFHKEGTMGSTRYIIEAL